jgi:tRNA(fMet)-specific endonuclease VapC
LKYLLDTNILSEPMNLTPNKDVMEKLKENAAEIATASPVWHELLYGAFKLPTSKKRKALETYLFDVILPDIPLFPYDSRAARWHAEERARLQAKGLTPAFVDGQVAAIAATNTLTLVTRNTSDYKQFRGLKIISWHT